MKAEVWVEVRPTEDEEKVRRALSNVFIYDEIRIEESEGKKYIVALGNGFKSLIKVHNLIKEQGIEDSARTVLMKGIDGNRVVFHLHKQAAYAGVLTFVTEENESPLGPITFIVETNDPKRLIDWLAPRTSRGRRLYEVQPPDDP
ncbi:RNA-binding domain-containing protein [Vulcanisaeta sp. JCM 16161]|uniref:RNA-binding domain-containing protein n=1 Tax=Vulcanisaeta sp. JCM 16161 TaxID=1295372 RepID=UPI0006CF668D|nr:RNA-binding domain-containing protein [Vulcanisaeta sp. JCM 16161]